MILSFNIEYRTNWGEEVRISGLFPESIPLHTTDGIYWTAELELIAIRQSKTEQLSARNGTVFRDLFSYQAVPGRYTESMIAGKIFRNNCIFIVLLLQKPYWHILKKRISRKDIRRDWLSRPTPHVSTKIIAWQFVATRNHQVTGTRRKRY